MRKTASLIAIFMSVSTLNAQNIKVAILDFENTSGIAKYDGLGKAMSSMLITDIEANVSPKRLQLVERAQIQKILKEQNFQASSAVDKTSSVKAGKLLGVKYLLVGDIYILNDVLVINARLTDTETGDIKFSKKQEGKLVGWLNLKTNIAKDLATAISMPFTEPTIADKEVNVATLTTFGNAIAAKDDGKLDRAEELINTVKELSPDFKYLDDLKSQLEGLKKQVEKNTADINNLNLEIADLQNLLKGAKTILNPTSPKEYILNAYLYKNAGDLLKSEEMFRKFITETKLEKFDLFCDYLEVLENNYGRSEAINIILKVSNSNLCKLAVAYKQDKMLVEKFNSEILNIECDSTLKMFIQYLNIWNFIYFPPGEQEAKIKFINNLIDSRNLFGDNYENLQKYFYMKNGPYNYAVKINGSFGQSSSSIYITELEILKSYKLAFADQKNIEDLLKELKISKYEFNRFSLKKIIECQNKEKSIQ